MGAAISHQEVLEVRARLQRLRSLIQWTVPMYLVFVLVAMYASGSVFATPSIFLLALLAAFGAMDVVILTRIHRLEAKPIRTDTDLRDARVALARLSRAVLLAGVALGGAFLAAFVVLMLVG